MKAFPSRGLYAITQCEGKKIEQIMDDVKAAISGGINVLQYRDKNQDDALTIAQELIEICNQHNIPFIVNDDVDLAAKIKADGVHLGKDDGDVESARRRLGNNAIIGVSCYNAVERALWAEQKGANYVAFGRFFPSGTKPMASPADVETLHKAKQVITVPIVAIGGILPENGAQLLAAGADVLAVIGGIFDRDPEQSACAYQCLFDE